MLEAVRAGRAAEPLARPQSQGNGQGRYRKGGPGAPPPEVEERFERLRAWRKGRAEARKVEVQVIAPNAVLWSIARSNPQDLAALALVEGMDSFRLDQYGNEILAVVQAELQRKLL